MEDILSLFSHFEVGNCTLSPRHNKTVSDMLDYATALYSKKHGVGGSDAHNLRNIGMYFTEVTTETGGKKAWLAAVARGEGRVVGRSIGALGLTSNVYQIIGQYYLSLRDPEVRRHMRAENYLAAAVLAPACLLGLPAFLNLSNSLRLEAVTLYLRRRLTKMQDERTRVPSPDLLEDPLD